MKERCPTRNDDFQRCTRAAGHEGEHRAPKPRAALRNVRVADPLWLAAQAVAKERGETLSDVIRDGLERYVKRYGVMPSPRP